MKKLPSNTKLVVKSSTKISLHERFTELRKLAPLPGQQPQQIVKRVAPPPPVSRPQYEAPRPRYDLPYSVVSHRDASPDYEHDRYMPVGRNRSLAERIADGVYIPSRRHAAYESDFDVPHRPVQDRLGGGGYDNYGWRFGRYRYGGFRARRPRFGFRFNRGGLGSARGFRRSRSFQNLRRWNSAASLASDGTGFRRRSRSAGSGKDFRFQRGGSGFANRRSFRRQGGREEISRDKLDAELDAYMSGTQNVIDVDVDVAAEA